MEVSGQALVFLWIYLLLLRSVRVGEGGPTIVGCVFLVIATLGLFAFALHAIYHAVRKADALSSVKETTSDHCDERPDDEMAPTNDFQGNSSQDSQEIEVTVVSAEDNQLYTASSNNANGAWEFLGLCTVDEAESRETADNTAIPRQASLDELASLAIAAGAERSEVSRLALALSRQLSP